MHAKATIEAIEHDAPQLHGAVWTFYSGRKAEEKRLSW